MNSRHNGWAKAAEYMTRSALLLEAYKLFFVEPFVMSSCNGDSETAEHDIEHAFVSRGVVALGPTTNLSILSRERACLGFVSFSN